MPLIIHPLWPYSQRADPLSITEIINIKLGGIDKTKENDTVGVTSEPLGSC